MAGRYPIERELGRGGMAVVFLAQDRKHDRHVVLKVLRPEVSMTLGAQRFLREVRIAAKLSHPHIVTLIDSDEVDGFLFSVMAYVEGESLRERLVREGRLSVGATSCGRWRAPSTTRTVATWCTGTSSPRTSSCAATPRS
jgi:serine/threonine-protein kinase